MNSAQDNTSNSDFFLQPNVDNQKAQSLKENLKKIWDGFLYYLRQIWPYVNQLISFLVYQITYVVKAIVKIALEQTGLKKD